jgi:ER lumen protein retaining receptor
MSALNAFRLLGDLVHVVAIVILLHKIFVVQNAQGLSRKTQELYLMVFVTRYLDLFTSFFDFYNSFMKVYFICATGILIISMRGTGGNPVMATYNADQDGFGYWTKVVLPCVVLSFPLCQGCSGKYYVWWSWWMQLCWTFSILLAAVAVLPQIIMFWKHREVQSRTGSSFILLMGLYRFLYILNYIYRAQTEPKKRHIRLEHICVAVQAIVAFAVFFWPPLLPPANHEGETPPPAPQPLWPQLIRAMVEDIWNPPSAVFFGFALVLPTALMAIHIGTSYGTLASEIAAILLILWLVVAIVLAFYSMLPAVSTNDRSCCCSSKSRQDVPAQDSADPNSLTVPLVELSLEKICDDVDAGTTSHAVVDADGIVHVHEEESSKNVLPIA